MTKQAFMKTIEMLLVVVFTTIFVLAVLPNSSNPLNEEISILNPLEQDTVFRDFIQKNTGCYNSTTLSIDYLIDRYLPTEYNYEFCSDTKPVSLPVAEVSVDTLYFAGNVTTPQSKIVRLYYWVE